jgi:ferric-dicitrate binding protein FerR (iron transport regulator)
MDSLRFKKLVERYERGELEGEERALMDDWFEKMAKHPLPWTDADQLAGEERLMREIRHEKAVRPLMPQWLKAAAGIALLIAASVAVWQWQSVDMLTVQTLGSTEKVILPDGSIIWVRENSTLTYPEKFTGAMREVSFTGEALFEIAKDAAHPFIIDCQGVTATVLGTSFNIKTTPSNTEVTVLTGKVSVTATGTAHEVIVLPYEKAVYTEAQQQLVKAEAKAEETAAVTEGTTYTMKFKGTRMEEIARRIESKFDVRLVLSDAAMGNCRITADLTDQSLTETLGMIAQALGYTYEINNRRIILTGEGCK